MAAKRKATGKRSSPATPRSRGGKKKPVSKSAAPAKASAAQRRLAEAQLGTTPVAAQEGAPSPTGFPIVGIGASAGGLEAFEAFFKAMPADCGMAFILVPHLDPTHVSILPELLQKHTAMPVEQIHDNSAVAMNKVYVIPPNKELSILNGVLYLMDLTQPRGVNLPIDTFFRSLARDQGARAIGIILSGTGTDGTLGLKAIKGEAGMVMVQDEESAKYGGMPHSAIGTGLADYILPVQEMPAQLIKYTRHAGRRAVPRITTNVGDAPDQLQKIFVLLRARTDHDFSLYKKNTICRRVERRMHVHQIDELGDYVRYLRESKHELEILFRELLINVTSFFRDPQAFDVLRDKVLPKLLADKPEDYTVRSWIPGCSSGEEAYSVAILLQECMGAMQRHFNVQVFGTDIDEEAVNAARTGLYPASICADLSAERLSRHFVKEDDGQYRIKKHIREMLIFAPQNIIKDPPFTKLDLLCCRNLLIYLEPELQQKLLPMFHYSLRPDGILFLGSSETIGQAHDFFAPVDKKWKIFRRKPSSAVGPLVLEFPTPPAQEGPQPEVPESVRRLEELSAVQLVETILQQSDTPPCAIIDEAYNVVYIHGRTGRYLEPAAGRASVNLLEMARPGLKGDLAAALRSVGQHKQEVVASGLRVEQNGGHLYLNLTVRPVLEKTVMRGMMMVVFEETPEPQKPKSKPERRVSRGKSKEVVDLEQELQSTREDLQTTIEELETSNEELKSTNEELQSTNEELQSTNEELETSKEELQSLNEEAATVNAELQSRIDELSKANDDMRNLLDSTEIATIFLDTELCVRRFTPSATEIIPLAGTDSGRPLDHFASNLKEVELTEYARLVLKELGVQEREVETKDGRWFIMRVRPYRTINNVIDGIVITFEEITRSKRAEAEIRELAKVPSEDPYPVLRFSRDGRLLYANPASQTLLEAWNCTLGQLLPSEQCEWIGRVLDTRTSEQIEIKQEDRILTLTLTPVAGAGYVNVYGHDVTQLKQTEQALLELQARHRAVSKQTRDGIVLIDPETLGILDFNTSAHASLGYTRDEFAQLRITDIDHRPTAAIAKDLKTLLRQGSSTAEIELQTKDGQLRHMLIKSHVVLADGKNLIQNVWIDRDHLGTVS